MHAYKYYNRNLIKVINKFTNNSGKIIIFNYYTGDTDKSKSHPQSRRVAVRLYNHFYSAKDACVCET